MKAKSLIFATVACLVFTGACGSNTKTEGSGQGLNSLSQAPNTVRVDSQFLLGTWSSGCVLDPKRLDIYVKEYLQYDLGTVNRFTTSYLDSACTAALYQQNVSATYDISELGVYIEHRTSVAITPQSSTAVGLFGVSGGFCGDANWRLNEERTFQDVSDCGIDIDAKLSLQGQALTGAHELSTRECEPRSPTNCTVMTYTRAN